jgi:hypothetical protein
LGRFLREFDRSDRDPASTAAKLLTFENTLRELFVNGYILLPATSAGPGAPKESHDCGSQPPAVPEASRDSPNLAHPAQPEGKTLTQIIFEQLEDIAEVR